MKFNIYRKPTHSETYLHYFAHASEDIKLGIAQSLFLRALRICSPEFLDKEINHIKCSFRNLAYPPKVLNEALLKARKVHFSKNKNISTDIDNKEDIKIMKLPYVKDLEKFKKPLQKMKTKLVFTYNNKLTHNLCKNKPQNSQKTTVYMKSHVKNVKRFM